MGETAAAAAIGGWRSAGLLQRLADLERDPGAAEAARELRPRPPPGAALGRPFSVGLLASLVLGVAACGLIVATRPTAEGQAAAAAVAAQAGPRSAAPAPLDLPILKSDRPAAFPLLVTGLDGALGETRIVLQDVPEALWFSRGQRRDEHTWELAATDLDDLSVTLRPGTPPAFRVGIDVIDANAALLTQTSAAVRLVEPSPATADVARPLLSMAAKSQRREHWVALSEVAALTWSTATVTKESVGREGRPRVAARVVDRPLPAISEPAREGLSAMPAAPQRPPGMSALGALTREPASEGRWLWWTLPVPGLASPR